MTTKMKWRTLAGGMAGALLIAGVSFSVLAEDTIGEEEYSETKVLTDETADAVEKMSAQTLKEVFEEESTLEVSGEEQAEDNQTCIDPFLEGSVRMESIIVPAGEETLEKTDDPNTENLFEEELIEDTTEDTMTSIPEDVVLNAADYSNTLTDADMASAQEITNDLLGTTLTAYGTSNYGKKYYKFKPSVTQVYSFRVEMDEQTANQIEPWMNLYTNGVLDVSIMDTIGDSYLIEAAGVLMEGTDYYFAVSSYRAGDVSFVLEAKGDTYLSAYGPENLVVDYKGGSAFIEPPELITAGTLVGICPELSWFRKTENGFITETMQETAKGTLISKPVYKDTDFRCEIKIGDHIKTQDFSASIRRLPAEQMPSNVVDLTEDNFGIERTDVVTGSIVYKFTPEADLTLQYLVKEPDSYVDYELFEGPERVSVQFDNRIWEDNAARYIKKMKTGTDYYLWVELEDIHGNPAIENVSLTISPNEEIYAMEKYFYAEYGTATDINVDIRGFWEGSESLTWQWYKKVGNEFRLIEGASGASYHTESINKDTVYRCEVAVGDKKSSAEAYVSCELMDNKLYDFERTAAENLTVNSKKDIANTDDQYVGGGKREARLFQFNPSLSGQHTLSFTGLNRYAYLDVKLFDGADIINSWNMDDEENDSLEINLDLHAGTAYYLLIKLRWNGRIPAKFIIKDATHEETTTTLVPTHFEQNHTSRQDISAQTGANPETSRTEEQISIPHRPSISKPKASKNGKLEIRWKKFKASKKNKGLWKKIRKVEIQYSTDRSFQSEIKTVQASKNKTKITVKGLQKNTTYYVRIRYMDGNRQFSDWSSIMSVKTKKR